MDALKLGLLIVVAGMWPAIAAADRCPTEKAAARGELLPTEPDARADTLFKKATVFFEQEDFAAAAVAFTQAARVYDGLTATLGRAAECAVLARSNAGTAYARAGMPVEARAVFAALAALPGTPDVDRRGAEAAVAELTRQIGTLALAGLPDGAAVRIDGLHVPLDEARAPIDLAVGTHALEVQAPFSKPYVVDLEIVGEQMLAHTVALVASETPASVRVEANLPRARVEVDGEPRGEAPIELTLPPGTHTYVVTAATYREHRASVDVRPGERTVVHVDLVPARAPWGVRAELYGMMIAGLSAPPFDTLTPAAGALIFHPYLRFRSFWFGFGVEVHARALDDVGAGGMVKFCPEALQFWRRNLAWCPGVFAGYLTAPHEGDDELQSGNTWIRLGTSLELRVSPFAFVRATPTVERMVYTSSTDPEIWATGVGLQLSAGIEL